MELQTRTLQTANKPLTETTLRFLATFGDPGWGKAEGRRKEERRKKEERKKKERRKKKWYNLITSNF